MSDEMYDGVLMNIVQKAQGIEGFYDAIFGFMRRKTDFFTVGDKARSTVLTSLERHQNLFNEDKQRQLLIKQKQEELKKKQEEEQKVKQVPVESTESKVEEITDEEAEKLSKGDQEMTASEAVPKSEEKEEKKEGEGDDSDDGSPPLIGNGLKTDKYWFVQTLGDFTLNVFIPDNVKAKSLDVVYTTKRLKVAVKGETPIIDGELPEKIAAEETLWTIDTIEGQRVLQITFDKADKMKWWDCAIVGDEKINTKKIEPENSKLSDLDGDTRQTVEKMMYDQQQKQKGLPSSDEQEKKNKLNSFMAAHPEMDFSKAKFT
jgi:hypothetical protein